MSPIWQVLNLPAPVESGDTDASGGTEMTLRFMPVLKMRNIRSLVPLIAMGEQLNPKSSSTNPRR